MKSQNVNTPVVWPTACSPHKGTNFRTALMDRAQHPHNVYEFNLKGIHYAVVCRFDFMWSGYVKLPANHPDQGRHLHQISKWYTVHEGLNYCQDGIIGFSTNNGYNLVREMMKGTSEHELIYYSFNYVRAETEKLASQVMASNRPMPTTSNMTIKFIPVGFNDCNFSSSKFDDIKFDDIKFDDIKFDDIQFDGLKFGLSGMGGCGMSSRTMPKSSMGMANLGVGVSNPEINLNEKNKDGLSQLVMDQLMNMFETELKKALDHDSTSELYAESETYTESESSDVCEYGNVCEYGEDDSSVDDSSVDDSSVDDTSDDDTSVDDTSDSNTSNYSSSDNTTYDNTLNNNMCNDHEAILDKAMEEFQELILNKPESYWTSNPECSDNPLYNSNQIYNINTNESGNMVITQECNDDYGWSDECGWH